MNECRNCGSTEVRDLGFIGQVAPFFLKRVFHLEIGPVPSESPVKRFIQAVTAVPQKALSRIRRTAALIELQACKTCSFIQTKHGFAHEALGQLYRDYRSDNYTRERIHYEPSYGAIAGQVGTGNKEIQTRVDTLTDWLQNRISPDDILSMLDYGGADGRLLPRIPGKKFIFDISDIAVSSAITRIKSETDLDSYTYIQVAHVLEHASEPLELVRKISRWVAPAGYLYIEVPQDFSNERIGQLVSGRYRGKVGIHEHINLYTVSSIAALVQSAGLQTVSVDTAFLDLGWTSCTMVRALGKKV